jgi:hypothetical protein
MTKKKHKRSSTPIRRNNYFNIADYPYNDYLNLYDDGGLLALLKNANEALGKSSIVESLGGMEALGGMSGIGGLANNIATGVGGLINPNGNTTGVGSAMQSIGSLASNIPGVGGVIGAGLNMVGGYVNAAFGSKINKEFVNATQDKAAEQSNYVSGATTTDQLMGDWTNMDSLDHVTKSQVGSEGWFSNKAKKKTKQLNKQIDEANLRSRLSIYNTADNINESNEFNALANYSAYGGPINMLYSGVMSPFGNQFGDGGDIHIKKANRGKFTSYCGGKVTSECIARGKRSSSPAVRKRATFAQNARGWKHANGGNLLATGGKRVDFTKYKPIYNRGFNPAYMNQVQDSLIARNFPQATRAAFLANILHESGGDPTKVGPGGFKGIIQWGKDRYPKSENLGNQIHTMIEDALTPKSPNWSDGGGGQPTISKLEDGYKKFWAEEDPYNATLYLTKGYVRPRDTKARTNRAKEAVNIVDNMKSLGGNLNTHGGNFQNGVIVVDEGGTHEQNPNEGIQMGVDEQGIPNLVEEGEVVFNDYVYSNRMKAPKSMKNKYKFKGNTFADVAKNIQKESEERPNDPISKRGLQANMGRLAQEQEGIRMKRESNKYARGGRLGRLFDGDGEEENMMPRARAKREGYEVDDKTYTNIPIPKETKSSERPTYMRYAPIIGSAISAFQDIFDKPDYSGPEAIRRAGRNTSMTRFAPVGQYLTYRPLDRDYYINKLNASSAATRRGLLNTSGGNRAAMSAGLLAGDYNYNQGLGDLARKSEEYNQAQRERVAGFNRQTDMFNSEGAMKADALNMQRDEMNLRAVMAAEQMKEGLENKYYNRRSNNMTSLLQGLGDIGWENSQANWLDTLAKRGVLKMDTRGVDTTSGTKLCKGGKLRTNKRKGFTYG